MSVSLPIPSAPGAAFEKDVAMLKKGIFTQLMTTSAVK